MKALNEEVRNLEETTMQGFIQNLKQSIDYFFEKAKNHKSLKNRSLLTFRSITEIYINSITKHIRNLRTMEDIKGSIIQMGEKMIKNFEKTGERIFKFSQQIIKNNSVR